MKEAIKRNYPSITVLGSTGSIGEQALDVAKQTGARVNAISANRNVKRMEEQAREMNVKACAMADEAAARDLKQRLADTGIRVYSGMDGISEMVAVPFENDEVVLNSIIGEAGLKPTLSTLQAKKRLALANKESLVCAGEIVMETARQNGVSVLPVDSEHSAIFQCLRSGTGKEIKKILLTASGGPFYGYTTEQLRKITVEQALAHPTWKMGAKITVDSATLMNKGFEVIEAVHLFGVTPDRIEVLIHRESIMHSAIEYTDHSVIAQMSVPDMRLCIQYALTHPERADAVIPELDFCRVGALTFQKPDTNAFPLLRVATDAIRVGGAVPAVVNAANEIAVAAFLSRRIGLTDIFDVVGETVSALEREARKETSLDGIFAFDALARACAEKRIPNR